jgi:hypothetical protein
VVVCACDLSYSGGKGERIMLQNWSGRCVRDNLKKKKIKRKRDLKEAKRNWECSSSGRELA